MYNSDPAMNMLKLIEIALGDYVDCGEDGLDSSVAAVVDRIKELETALRHIESKGHLSSKMAARVARAALRDFTISGTRRALGGDA